MTYRISTTRSELNLLPAFFFTVGSVATITLCQLHPLTNMYVLPGVVIAMTCMAGIVAGLVGRHWLVGMAFSLGISSIAANLYFLNCVFQSPISSTRSVISFELMQLIPIVVLVSSLPALLMRYLRSWRLVIDRSPRGLRTIEDLLVLMTFVALMIAVSVSASSNDDFSKTVISLGSIGAITVTIFLPLVRNSLSESRMATNLSHSDFGYFMILGVPLILLDSISEGVGALIFGIPYCAFAISMKAGIHCLDLTGVKFRNHQMDLEAKDYAIPESPDSSRSFHALGPLSDDTFSNGPSGTEFSVSPKSNRDVSIIQGRWALGSIALVVIALSILKMLFAKS